MTPEVARDRAALIAAQDADAPKLTDRLDAEAMRVLVEAFDALQSDYQKAELSWRTEIARANADRVAAEAALAEERAACIAAVARLLVGGPEPPSWSADLYDCCEGKEDAYDAGVAYGEATAARAALRALQARNQSS